MKDAIILITGAKGGLGNFVTEAFLATGATVVGTSRSIRAEDFDHPNFIPAPADFSKPESVQELVNSVIKRFGHVDALVHVMGGFAGGLSIAETDDSTWSRMRDQNLTGAFYAIRAVLPHMRERKHGRIIAVGSLTGAEPHANLGAYVIFKSAVHMLIRTVALENSDLDITANAILPGTMDTAANREAMANADYSTWVKPIDVAKTILWLAADEAAHVNGALLAMAGSNG